MTDRFSSRAPRPGGFEDVLDLCVEALVAGTSSIEACLARFPEHREALEPALRDVAALVSLPVPPSRPDSARRASFMAALRETPQQAPRRRFGLPSIPVLPWFETPPSQRFSEALRVSGFGAFALRAVPAAAVALLAIIVVLAQGGGTASAATLTVFTGQVERQVDGTWQALDDGARVQEGESIRTVSASHALLTFPDGSTAALEPDTQVALQRLDVNGRRQIELTQATGRLWNDVVTVTGSTSYLVRTPHATVEAHGTVFETVVNGDTAVTTADGRVRVVSASSSVDVLAGQIVRATAERIDTPEQIPFIGEITVRGSLAAALSSPDGGATGLLPSGVVFRQVPGVTTTIPNDGEQQRMFVGDIAPGVYTLVLRRYDEGDGIVVVETPSGRLNIPIPANVQTARILIAIDILDGGVFMRALDTQVEVVESDEAPAVRVVESARTREAVALNAAVAVETEAATVLGTPAATGTREIDQADDDQDRDDGDSGSDDGDDRRDDRDRPDATRTPERGTATATVRPTPALSFEQELRLATAGALQSGDNERLSALLEDLLSGNDRQDETRLRALAAVMQDPAARIRIVALIQVGAAPRLSRDLDDAVDEIDDRSLRETLRSGLGELLEPARDREQDSDRRGSDSGDSQDTDDDADDAGRDEDERGRRGLIPEILDGVRDRLRDRESNRDGDDRPVIATTTPTPTPTPTPDGTRTTR
jgi:hypothetical protein